MKQFGRVTCRQGETRLLLRFVCECACTFVFVCVCAQCWMPMMPPPPSPTHPPAPKPTPSCAKHWQYHLGGTVICLLPALPHFTPHTESSSRHVIWYRRWVSLRIEEKAPVLRAVPWHNCLFCHFFKQSHMLLEVSQTLTCISFHRRVSWHVEVWKLVALNILYKTRLKPRLSVTGRPESVCIPSVTFSTCFHLIMLSQREKAMWIFIFVIR